MNKDEFNRAVETDMQASGAPFDREELRQFLDDMAPLIQPTDPAGRWADAYRGSMGEGPTA
jgi:hypothetical protein